MGSVEIPPLSASRVSSTSRSNWFSVSSGASSAFTTKCLLSLLGSSSRLASYLLSGLVKCKACNRALSGQDAKSGQFAYYVCQPIMKRGKDACHTPRLNARRFEGMIVEKIRSNILTEGSITELMRAVDAEMDGLAHEQRQRLETIEEELEDVKRRLATSGTSSRPPTSRWPTPPSASASTGSARRRVLVQRMGQEHQDALVEMV